MRERAAKWLTGAVGVLIVCAALGFATLQHAAPTTANGETSVDGEELIPDEPLDAARVAMGKEVYDEQACSLCHLIAGEGDPRYPLDGIGARRSAEFIRKYIAPTEEIRSSFPGETYSMKQPYHDLPEDEMNALVDYLRSLR